jgi:hypothetical protein
MELRLPDYDLLKLQNFKKYQISVKIILILEMDGFGKQKEIMLLKLNRRDRCPTNI